MHVCKVAFLMDTDTWYSYVKTAFLTPSQLNVADSLSSYLLSHTICLINELHLLHITHNKKTNMQCTIKYNQNVSDILTVKHFSNFIYCNN